MVSRSCMDLLNLVSLEDFPVVNRIPTVMRVPGVISDFFDDGEERHQNSDTDRDIDTPRRQQRRIIVANQLPIKSRRDPETKKWCFELDNDRLVVQLKDGFKPDVEIIYVGSLTADIDVSDQEQVSQELSDRFNCIPTFLTADIKNMFYHGVCKHYLWPLFHYMLPMSPGNGARFGRQQWQAYVSANMAFAKRVIGEMNPDDVVWIHDYHLMLMATFLRKFDPHIKVGFFLHSPFPSSEIYKTIPVRDEILRGLLNCDLIGFHTFDYARHFLTCCSRMLGIDYESKRGYIGLDYCGRTVIVKIQPAGIHMDLLESVLSHSDFPEKVRELKQKYEGKIVMVGVDDTDIFKGISLKFQAMGELLEKKPDLRGKVVLVQILNPARSEGKDVQELEREINSTAQDVNKKYGGSGYNPIVLINGPVSTEEKSAYLAIAECCVVTPVRDGMNLMPYKYTVCRQGSPVLDEALGIDKNSSSKKSALIVSEFIGCSPSLSGAIRVNPWNVDDVSDAMFSAITMKEAEKCLRHEKHYKYISTHDVAYWARSFDQDLHRACGDHHNKKCWHIGFGLGVRIVALGINFRKLVVENIVPAYCKSNSRLILLDYDGTMMPDSSVDKTPSDEVILLLKCLCSDPKNIVFIVSGRGKDSLSKWFSPCEKLGISAEHGYFTRWNKDSAWETCKLTMDSNWKSIALPVMELYTESTDGSFIEQKETALVWHYKETDFQFGSWQAKELLDHLENVLANEPVVVKRGQYIVEVKPQGVSKGKVVQDLILSMQSQGKSPDFVLCIGDDRSDEDMFEAIAPSDSKASLPPVAEVFACTIGQKPSMAKYFLDDTGEVIKLLQGLAAASDPKFQ